MSIERELLKKILILYREDKFCILWEAVNEIEKLLAQPEPEPVAWMYERQSESFIERTLSVGFEKNFDGITTPLYTAPPKREPLSTKQAEDLWETSNFKSAVSYYIFDEICVAVEQYHGIGDSDEQPNT